MRRTEERNPKSAAIDTMSPVQIAQLIVEDNAQASEAVARATEALGTAMKSVAKAFKEGGRIIYVGAGTSARIAGADAAEMPPTFGVDPNRFLTLAAGGAITQAKEGAEDDRDQAAQDFGELIEEIGDGGHIVIGISASGSTPYVLAVIQAAKARGIKTVGIANNPGATLFDLVDTPVLLDTGPEVIAGSTRMKGGTAQKIALNTISTGAMVLAGLVKGNMMSHMRPANEKLRERAIGIVMQERAVSRDEAQAFLERNGWSLPDALSE
ncbi:MAG: N-acetylmuramic acid 6-phosphate etherase [Fimbriimonadales bacterium]